LRLHLDAGPAWNCEPPEAALRTLATRPPLRGHALPGGHTLSVSDAAGWVGGGGFPGCPRLQGWTNRSAVTARSCLAARRSRRGRLRCRITSRLPAGPAAEESIPQFEPNLNDPVKRIMDTRLEQALAARKRGGPHGWATSGANRGGTGPPPGPGPAPSPRRPSTPFRPGPVEAYGAGGPGGVAD
jgi:hypothetical protein